MNTMDEALKKALDGQQSLIDKAKAEQRGMTDDEQDKFNFFQTIIDAAADKCDVGNEENNRGESESKTAAISETGSGENKRTAAGYSHETAAEVLSICREFDIEPDDYIKRGLSIEDTRKAVIDELVKRNKPVGSRVEIVCDETEKFRAAATDGILMRCGIMPENPADGANVFRGLSIRDIAIDCLERENRGEDFRHMDSMQLYEKAARSFYNPTAAFPAILDAVIQKSYIEGLKKSRKQYDKWTSVGTLSDFKETKNHEYIMSLGGTLEEIPENGELPAYKPLDVAMPTRKLKTYGRQFTMTREAFINDDIGLITTLPQRYAALSANTQNEKVYAKLLSNEKIFDGKPLFDVSRGNTLKTGTAISFKAIETMIYMLGMQKDAAGNQLQLTPDLFIVPLGMGTQLRQILVSPTIHTSDNTQAYNPYSDMHFTIVEDVTINAMIKPGNPLPWFMGVSGETIQIDYLNGQKEPNIRRGEVPGKLGFVWDVYHDFDVSVKHPQTLIRNPGVVLSLGE